MTRGRGGGRQRGRGKGNREQGGSYQKDDYRENRQEQSRSQSRKPKEYPDGDSSNNASRDRSDVERLTSRIQGTRWQDKKDDGQRDRNRYRSNSNENQDDNDRDNPRNRSAPNQRGKGSGPASKQQNQKGAWKPFPKKVPKAGSAETQTGSLIEQLSAGSYECPVCCDRIKCEARVWSCKTCFVVFHLGCIKKWAKSPSASAEGKNLLLAGEEMDGLGGGHL